MTNPAACIQGEDPCPRTQGWFRFKRIPVAACEACAVGAEGESRRVVAECGNRRDVAPWRRPRDGRHRDRPAEASKRAVSAEREGQDLETRGAEQLPGPSTCRVPERDQAVGAARRRSSSARPSCVGPRVYQWFRPKATQYTRRSELESSRPTSHRRCSTDRPIPSRPRLRAGWRRGRRPGRDRGSAGESGALRLDEPVEQLARVRVPDEEMLLALVGQEPSPPRASPWVRGSRPEGESRPRRDRQESG